MNHSNPSGDDFEIATYANEGQGFHLLSDFEPEVIERFLEHALEVYLSATEDGQPPNFTDILLMARADTKEASVFCIHYFKSFYGVDDGQAGKLFSDNYFKVDMYYKEDLIFAWDIKLNLLFYDQSRVHFVRNKPFKEVW